MCRTTLRIAVLRCRLGVFSFPSVASGRVSQPTTCAASAFGASAFDASPSTDATVPPPTPFSAALVASQHSSSSSSSFSFGYQCHTTSKQMGTIRPSMENPTEPTSETSGPMFGKTIATKTVKKHSFQCCYKTSTRYPNKQVRFTHVLTKIHSVG